MQIKDKRVPPYDLIVTTKESNSTVIMQDSNVVIKIEEQDIAVNVTLANNSQQSYTDLNLTCQFH